MMHLKLTDSDGNEKVLPVQHVEPGRYPVVLDTRQSRPRHRNNEQHQPYPGRNIPDNSVCLYVHHSVYA